MTIMGNDAAPAKADTTSKPLYYEKKNILPVVPFFIGRMRKCPYEKD